MTNTTTKTKPEVDQALWTVRPSFGVAGGPDVVVLTDEGNERAFSVGAQVRRGGPAEALCALASGLDSGYLSIRGDGARVRRTSLGRFDQIAWGHLRGLGLVESYSDAVGDGVRLTDSGKRAVAAAYEEQARLLDRCNRAAFLCAS